CLEAGDAETAREELQHGLQCAQAALRMARAAGYAFGEVCALTYLGQLRGLAGEDEEALALLGEARGLAVAHGYGNLESWCIRSLAELLRKRGNAEGAVTHWRSALQAAGPDKDLMAGCHRGLYRAYKDMGRPAEALAEYERYHELTQEMESSKAAARTRVL